MVKIYGTPVKRPFSKVEKEFKKNFEERNEVGADFCVYYNNEKVVDIWGGYKNLSTKKEWDKNTLVPVFSTSKAVSAACLSLLNSRGYLDYNERVSTYWPEFAQKGKENITVQQLLQHRAGLSAIDKKLTPEIINNYDKLDKILAKQKPHWEPGTQQGYHVWSIGWYMSALLSKIDPKGRRISEFIKEEFNQKAEGEFYIALDNDFDMSRIAKLIPFPKMKGILSMPFKFVKEFFKPWSVTYKSMLNPSFVSDHSNFNKEKILKLEIGSGNGVGNSRGLASIMNELFINSSSSLYLSESTLSTIMEYPDEPQQGFEDRVFKQDAFRFHCGFMKPSSKHSFSNNKESFGGFGAGGSFVMVDPKNNITMAYTMNKMSSNMMNVDREVALRNAVYDSLN